MRFRGQYAVVREPRSVPEGFLSHGLGDHRLLVHTELPVAIRGDAALVGQALDPACPGHTQDEVLEYLLPDPVGRSSRLAGRWALLIPGKMALHDACGAMGIQWAGDAVASSTRLLDLVAGPFTPLDQKPAEHYSGQPIAGPTTDYAEVKSLLANHYLDWGKGPVRFHPVRSYPALPASQIAPLVADMLSGIVKAAANRSALAVGLTAGYDSRTLAGAVRQAGAPAFFFTLQDKFACHAGHYDIEAGRKIAQTVGADHRVIISPNCDDPDCAASETMPTRKFHGQAQACRQLEGKLVLSGWCSEVGRTFWRFDPTYEKLRDQIGMFDDPALRQWHAEASKLPTRLLDFAYWELRCQWVSAALNILHTGCDWIPVYSCRDLLNLMLSVGEEERAAELNRQVIRLLCPELLGIPFNPRRYWSETIRRWVVTHVRNLAIKASKRLGLYAALRAFKA